MLMSWGWRGRAGLVALAVASDLAAQYGVACASRNWEVAHLVTVLAFGLLMQDVMRAWGRMLLQGQRVKWVVILAAWIVGLLLYNKATTHLIDATCVAPRAESAPQGVRAV